MADPDGRTCLHCNEFRAAPTTWTPRESERERRSDAMKERRHPSGIASDMDCSLGRLTLAPFGRRRRCGEGVLERNGPITPPGHHAPLQTAGADGILRRS